MLVSPLFRLDSLPTEIIVLERATEFVELNEQVQVRYSQLVNKTIISDVWAIRTVQHYYQSYQYSWARFKLTSQLCLDIFLSYKDGVRPLKEGWLVEESVEHKVIEIITDEFGF